MIESRKSRSGWGVDWGAVGEMPRDVHHVDSDAAAAEVVASARRDGRPVPPFVLTGGDLARTLGIRDAAPTPESPRASTRAVRVPADLGRVDVDGRRHWFVAHLVARRSWWRGRLLAVTNASFMGAWNIAPRAHPGDGRFQVLDAAPALMVRWAARRRLRSGTHVPHPAIAQRRVTEARFALDPPLDVYLDGRKLIRASCLTVSVVPAALDVWIPIPPASGLSAGSRRGVSRRHRE